MELRRIGLVVSINTFDHGFRGSRGGSRPQMDADSRRLAGPWSCRPFEDLFYGVAFECLDDATEIVRAVDAVDVVVEDDAGEEAESIVLAAVGEGVGDDFNVRALVNIGSYSTVVEVTN